MAGDTHLAVSVLLRARDQLTGSVGKARAVTRKLNRTVTTVGRNPGFAKLRGHIGRTSDAAKRLARRVGKIGLGVGGAAAAATAAVGGLTKAVADQGDEAAKMADQYGLSVKTLQEYQFAAQRMGVAQGTFNQSLSAFAKRVAYARKGHGALVTQLKQSNPKLLEQITSTHDMGKALQVYLKAIAQAPDATAKAGLASAGFSRAGQDMVRVTRDGADNIAALRQRADALGLVLSDKTARDAETFQDKLANMQGALSGVRNVIGGQLLPVFSKGMAQITQYVVNNQDAIRSWAKGFAAKLPGRIQMVRQQFARFVSAVGDVIDKAQPLIDIGKRLADRFGGMHVAAAGLIAVIGAPIIAPLISLTASIASLGAALVGIASKALPFVIAGVRTLTGVLIANPIGATVAAIATAAFLIYKYWGPISGFVQRLWNDVSGWVSGAYATIKQWLGFDPLSLMRPVWNAISQYVSRLFGDIKAILSGDFSAIGQLFLDLNPLNLLRPAFTKAWNWLSNIDWSGLGQALVMSLVRGIKSAAGAIKAAVTGAVQSAFSKVKNTVASGFSQAADGVQAAGGTVAGAAKSAAGWVRGFLPGSDAKRGPLSDLTAAGRALPATLAKGIGDNQAMLGRAAARAAGTARQPLAASRHPNVIPLLRAPAATARPDTPAPTSARPAQPSAAQALGRRQADHSRPGDGRGTRIDRVEFAPQVTIQVGDEAAARDVGDELDRRLAAWQNIDLWSGIQNVAADGG